MNKGSSYLLLIMRERILKFIKKINRPIIFISVIVFLVIAILIIIAILFGYLIDRPATLPVPFESEDWFNYWLGFASLLATLFLDVAAIILSAYTLDRDIKQSGCDIVNFDSIIIKRLPQGISSNKFVLTCIDQHTHLGVGFKINVKSLSLYKCYSTEYFYNNSVYSSMKVSDLTENNILEQLDRLDYNNFKTYITNSQMELTNNDVEILSDKYFDEMQRNPSYRDNQLLILELNYIIDRSFDENNKGYMIYFYHFIDKLMRKNTGEKIKLFLKLNENKTMTENEVYTYDVVFTSNQDA